LVFFTDASKMLNTWYLSSTGLQAITSAKQKMAVASCLINNLSSIVSTTYNMFSLSSIMPPPPD
jgi:hypothetical protein